MRIVLYSDLQLHPYKDYSQLVGGVNDRLLDHFKVLDQILDYTLANQIKYLFCAGDVFEVRAKVDVIAAKMLCDWKAKVSKHGINQVDVVGNHDLVNKSTLHNSIELYNHIPGVTVTQEPQWIKVGDYGASVYCVPYQHRLEDMKNALNVNPGLNVNPDKSIAIIHYGLYDVPMESHHIIKDQGYDTEGQLRLADLEPLLKHVKHIFFGHFHITSDVTPRVHFIGTPLQHNWGEREVKTRFLDVDLDTGIFKEILTTAPRFYQWENVKDIDLTKLKGNFCRVNSCDSLEQREEILNLFKQAGVRGGDAFIAKKQTNQESRLGLNLGMSFQEMAARMIDADKVSVLDKTKLKNIFSELLTTASTNKNA